MEAGVQTKRHVPTDIHTYGQTDKVIAIHITESGHVNRGH